MSDMESYDCLPEVALDFVDAVVKKVRYRKKVRGEVRDELLDHFYMALKDCKSDEELQQVAEEAIAEFGDVKVLAGLIRRGKKRCRPLWRTIVARTVQAFGLLVVSMIFYVIWFWLGEPSPSIDYLGIINKQVSAEIKDEEDAWVNYEKAIELYVKPGEKADAIIKKYFSDPDCKLNELDAADMNILRDWVKRNEQAWDEYTVAAGKPFVRLNYGFGEGASEKNKSLLYILLPHLTVVRDIARVGVLRSEFAVIDGNHKGALDNCIVLLNISRHWQERATLIDSLVGMAISSYGVTQATEVVGKGVFSAEELKLIQGRMYASFAEGYPHTGLKGERFFVLDRIQHCFTKGGPGGGHIVPKELIGITGDDFSLISTLLDGEFNLRHFSQFFSQAGRRKTVGKVNELFDFAEKMYLLSPYEQMEKEMSFDEQLVHLPLNRYMVIRIMAPALDKVCHLRYERKAEYEAVLTVLAIKRWEAEKGSLPENLDVLVEAGMLRELPDDPYAQGSLVYRVVDGDFILYSVGKNFKDDDGVQGDYKRKYKPWAKEGDTVFWPVLE